MAEYESSGHAETREEAKANIAEAKAETPRKLWCKYRPCIIKFCEYRDKRPWSWGWFLKERAVE